MPNNLCINLILGLFSDEACEKFEELVLEKNLTMTVTDIQNEVCTVNLVEVNENNQIQRVDIANALIQSGLVIKGKDPLKKGLFFSCCYFSSAFFKKLSKSCRP